MEFRRARLDEQPQRVARLHVVRKEEHPDLGMPLADLLRGNEPFVRVRRRHADVDDRNVRPFEADLPQQRRCVFDLSDYVDVCSFEKPHDPLAGEHRVLGDDYAHGSSVRST